MEARRAALVVAAVLTFSAAVVGVAVTHHSPLSAIDEATYVDYLVKIDGGTIWMPRGDLFAQESARIVFCRGIEVPGENAPVVSGDCAHRQRDPATLANGGVSTAAGHPPTYFLVTYVG